MKAAVRFALMALLLSSQVMASSGAGFKEAIDELNYSLTVEWDQADQGFYEKQKDAFSQKLLELSEQGMTNEELIQQALRQIKDETLKRDVELLFSRLMKEEIGQESLNIFTQTLSEGMYSNGASWNGRATVITIVAIVAVATVAAIVNANINTSRSNIKR